METVIQGSTLQTLRAGLRGTAHAPGAQAARRRPGAHRRPLEHHGQGRLQIHHERDRAGLHAGDGGRGRGYLARVTEATRPFQTGDTYVNFMELDDASAEKVKAAYAPEDFERLVALKDRYDPHNVFRFNRNIAPSKAG